MWRNSTARDVFPIIRPGGTREASRLMAEFEDVRVVRSWCTVSKPHILTSSFELHDNQGQVVPSIFTDCTRMWCSLRSSFMFFLPPSAFAAVFAETAVPVISIL